MRRCPSQYHLSSDHQRRRDAQCNPESLSSLAGFFGMLNVAREVHGTGYVGKLSLFFWINKLEWATILGAYPGHEGIKNETQFL